MPLGNLIMRGAGALIALIAFVWLEAAARPARRNATPTSSSTRISLFNCMLVLAGMPLAGLVYRLAERIVR